MKVFPLLALHLILEYIHCGTVHGNRVENVSLTFLNKDSMLIEGNCSQCLCYMYSNSSVSSFNCYRNNQTCQVHLTSDQYQLFRALPSLSTTFYYRSLPQCPPSINCSALSVTMGSFMLSKSSNLSEIDFSIVWFGWRKQRCHQSGCLSLVLRLISRWSNIQIEFHLEFSRSSNTVLIDDDLWFWPIPLIEFVHRTTNFYRIFVSNSGESFMDLRTVALSSRRTECAESWHHWPMWFVCFKFMPSHRH